MEKLISIEINYSKGKIMFKNYFKYLKESFSPLTLNNEKDLSNERASHPLELFFDLVFVVALGKVGHVFLHPDIRSIIGAVILFLSIYQIWRNITKFNTYFFKQGLVISFLFLFVMLPVFFIASIPNYKDPHYVYLLIVSFAISRLSLTLAWYKLVHKNKLIQNEYINKLSKAYSITFLISTILTLLTLINYRLFTLMLIVILILEISSTISIYKKLNNDPKLTPPLVDTKLMQERRVLFVILVWGEALVTAGSVFSEYSSFSTALFMSLAMFLIIGFFFIRAVMSFGDTYIEEGMSPGYLNFTDYTFPLVSLSLFVSIAGIASAEHVNELSKWIVIFDLAYINGSHFLANLGGIKANNLDYNLAEFVKLDNFFLIIQFIITFILIFTKSSDTFVYLILFIFILHAIAIPIRYSKTEYF